VLLFLVHHRIPIATTDYYKPRRLAVLPDVKETGYRRPTAAEAARYFNVTRDTTIHTWWSKREKIFGNIKITKSYPLKWPALEKELVKHFNAAREKNKTVTVHWFRRYHSKSGNAYTPAFPNYLSFQMGGFRAFYGAIL
jgi:hypothetical protein